MMCMRWLYLLRTQRARTIQSYRTSYKGSHSLKSLIQHPTSDHTNSAERRGLWRRNTHHLITPLRRRWVSTTSGQSPDAGHIVFLRACSMFGCYKLLAAFERLMKKLFLLHLLPALVFEVDPNFPRLPGSSWLNKWMLVKHQSVRFSLKYWSLGSSKKQFFADACCTTIVVWQPVKFSLTIPWNVLYQSSPNIANKGAMRGGGVPSGSPRSANNFIQSAILRLNLIRYLTIDWLLSAAIDDYS